MSEQNDETSEPRVGDIVEVQDPWTGVTLRGTVQSLTDGGFYWVEFSEQEYVMWTPYNGSWSKRDD